MDEQNILEQGAQPEAIEANPVEAAEVVAEQPNPEGDGEIVA
jgi:hypothetical protein